MSKEGSSFYKKAEGSLKKYNHSRKEQKLEQAIDLFQKAANSFQLSNEWAQAGDSFAQLADCLQNKNKLSEAASASTNAGRMYLKNQENYKKAYDSFAIAARYYRENSKPIQAAQLLGEAGKLFDEKKDYDDSIQSYKDSAQVYDDENKPIQAANQIAIIADIYSSQNKWIEASDYYKDVAKRRYSERLTKTSATEYCMKSVICRMAADDVIGAEKYMNNYMMDFPQWERSREYTMLRALIKAFNNHDSEGFSNVIDNYTEFTTLDNWMVVSFKFIKDMIDNDEEEEIC